MTSLQKGVLWMAGCLVFVFASSIGLSWIVFGYLDAPTTVCMILMLLPVLAVAAVIALRAGRDRATGASASSLWAAERKPAGDARPETPAGERERDFETSGAGKRR